MLISQSDFRIRWSRYAGSVHRDFGVVHLFWPAIARPFGRRRIEREDDPAGGPRSGARGRADGTGRSRPRTKSASLRTPRASATGSAATKTPMPRCGSRSALCWGSIEPSARVSTTTAICSGTRRAAGTARRSIPSRTGEPSSRGIAGDEPDLFGHGGLSAETIGGGFKLKARECRYSSRAARASCWWRFCICPALSATCIRSVSAQYRIRVRSREVIISLSRR